MKLVDEIERVSGYLNALTGVAPSSEMDTCHWVIYPLLLATGYNHHDIYANLANSVGHFPDYTLLPHSPHTWYLEAKAWNVSLQDAHVIQAMNYAHTTGNRWVVLSNGREWRLYDDHIHGVEAGKRIVCTARVEDKEQLEQFLCALSKTSVMTGNLTRYVARTRLNAILEAQLINPSSELIKSLFNSVKNTYGLIDLQKADICDFFGRCLKSDVSVPELETVFSVSSVKRNGKTLIELMQSSAEVRHSSPNFVLLPDNSEEIVSSWRDVTATVILWLKRQNRLPAPPFSGQERGIRYLYNTTPVHANGEEMEHRVLQMNGDTLYLHVNRSAQDFIRCLIVLCREAGQSPESFTVGFNRNNQP